ncbi:MAG: hypothetical protein M3133_01450 [Actinomycetota bacterium]|nr:hypothetical protein [Actinomycetota bacterium]
MTRVDVASGEVTSADVGVEPHDVKFASPDLAYVADEAGRRLLEIDPDRLKVRRAIAMPGPPHDLLVADGAVWVTIVGSDALLRVRGTSIDRFPTGRSPHDLVLDRRGRIWFSNWHSEELSVRSSAACPWRGPCTAWR